MPSRTLPWGGAQQRVARLPLATSLGRLFKTVQAGLLVLNGACGIMLPPLSDAYGGRGGRA
jgi:hypothetical protein